MLLLCKVTIGSFFEIFKDKSLLNVNFGFCGIMIPLFSCFSLTYITKISFVGIDLHNWVKQLLKCILEGKGDPKISFL